MEHTASGYSCQSSRNQIYFQGMVSKKIYISGRVQGVGFRFHAHEQAGKLGLKGWVKNLSDGRVEMLINGDESHVKSMIKWAHKGPVAAKVEKVEVQETKEAAGDEFCIRREGD